MAVFRAKTFEYCHFDVVQNNTQALIMYFLTTKVSLHSIWRSRQTLNSLGFHFCHSLSLCLSVCVSVCLCVRLCVCAVTFFFLFGNSLGKLAFEGAEGTAGKQPGQAPSALHN